MDMINNKDWQIDSWKNYPVKQQPTYKDQSALLEVENELRKKVPLVTVSEINLLQDKLSDVAQGKAFLLQAGDCAESFAEFSEINLKEYFRTLLQMNAVLMYGIGKPIVKVGRVAGQFAKPRSDDFEEQNGVKLPSYRGDIINNIEFTEESRIPDPKRMLSAYNQSSATLNYLRSLAKGGYASLCNISKWNQDFLDQSPQSHLFQDLTDRIQASLKFMESTGIDLEKFSDINQTDLFSSHEGLLLNYDYNLTFFDEVTEKYYCGSAHMLWIGNRTLSPDEAHVEFMRGIANPIGVKIGTKDDLETVLRIVDILNPDNIPGRVTLITRLGENNVDSYLPKLIQKMQEYDKRVAWLCDPMHSNTTKSPSGYKTRSFNKILNEVKQVIDVHRAESSYLGGIHVELTGQNVTECIGGAQAISEVNLKDRYKTHCDPRLNASQSIELSFLISEGYCK